MNIHFQTEGLPGAESGRHESLEEGLARVVEESVRQFLRERRVTVTVEQMDEPNALGGARFTLVDVFIPRMDGVEDEDRLFHIEVREDPDGAMAHDLASEDYDEKKRLLDAAKEKSEGGKSGKS